MSWAQDTAQVLRERICTTDAPVALAVIDGSEAAISTHPSDAVAGLRFPIDSNSKTMLGTTLAAHVLAGRAELDDEIRRWVDVGENGTITLRQLVRHTSGLPRLADGFDSHPGFDPEDPYAHYTEDLLLEDVRAATLGPHEPAYSNLGFQLLGLLVARIGGAPLVQQFRDVIFQPLGMSASTLYSDSANLDRLAAGSARGLPTKRWHAAVPGAGEVESTIGDMVAYLRAAMSPPSGAIGDALELAIGSSEDDSLAWDHYPDGVIGHGGASAGFMSVMLCQPSTDRGVVVLAGKGDDPFGELAFRALVGAELPAPAEPITADHPAVVGLVGALRSNDVDAARPHLDDVFFEAPEIMDSTAGEFDALTARVTDAAVTVLPGQPPAALLDLDDEEVLQIFVHPDSDKIHGFFVCPRDGPYAG